MKRTILALAAFALVVAGASAQSTGVVYSDITAFTGFGFAQNPSAPEVGNPANQITRLIADDIACDMVQLSSATTRSVQQVRLSIANFNATAVSVRARIRFWDNDGVAGAPGTFLVGFTFNPISYGPGVTVLTGLLGPGLTIPADGTFWAGVTFDNNGGTTGATAAQMDAFGQGIFNPPAVGTSGDIAFETTLAGNFNLVNNPVGGFFNFGGSPVANFGWEFTVVPEPTTWALLGIGAFSAIPAWRRWRAGKAAKAMAATTYAENA